MKRGQGFKASSIQVHFVSYPASMQSSWIDEPQIQLLQSPLNSQLYSSFVLTPQHLPQRTQHPRFVHQTRQEDHLQGQQGQMGCAVSPTVSSPLLQLHPRPTQHRIETHQQSSHLGLPRHLHLTLIRLRPRILPTDQQFLQRNRNDLIPHRQRHFLPKLRSRHLEGGFITTHHLQEGGVGTEDCGEGVERIGVRVGLGERQRERREERVAAGLGHHHDHPLLVPDLQLDRTHPQHLLQQPHEFTALPHPHTAHHLHSLPRQPSLDLIIIRHMRIAGLHPILPLPIQKQSLPAQPLHEREPRTVEGEQQMQGVVIGIVDLNRFEGVVVGEVQLPGPGCPHQPPQQKSHQRQYMKNEGHRLDLTLTYWLLRLLSPSPNSPTTSAARRTSPSSSPHSSPRCPTTPARMIPSTSTEFTRSRQMKSMALALFWRQSSSWARYRARRWWRWRLASRSVVVSSLRASRERSQEQEVKGCRMLLNLLKMLLSADVCRVVNSTSRSFTRCRYSCSDSISSRKCTCRNRFSDWFTSRNSRYHPSYSKLLSLLSRCLRINSIPTIISPQITVLRTHLLPVSLRTRLVGTVLATPVVVVAALVAPLALVALVAPLVAVVPPVVVVVVAFGFVVLGSLLVLGLVLLGGVGLGLADGVPKLLLLVLLRLAEVLLLEEDLADTLRLEDLLRNLLIMRNGVLIVLVTEILHVQQHHTAVGVVYTRQQPLEPLPALQLDVHLVAEEVLHRQHAHYLNTNLSPPISNKGSSRDGQYFSIRYFSFSILDYPPAGWPYWLSTLWLSFFLLVFSYTIRISMLLSITKRTTYTSLF